LARVEDFVNTTCPTCGGPATRETDTMDGFACSSWYFLRFADPHNNEKPFDQSKAKYWLPVDQYIGGAEHAVMHLLYARMWTKVMQDEGLIDFSEPFKQLLNHGMILAPDGTKMSKSKGNTIEPDVLIEQGYGADAIRVMELFIGPWNQKAAWSVEGMGGSFRFLQRVWVLVHEFNETQRSVEQSSNEALLKVTHKTIKSVSDDMSTLGFNTAIASLMEMTNALYKLKSDNFASGEWKFALESLVQMLAPFAPHMSEELWQQLGHDDSIHTSIWPKYDEQYLVDDTVTIVVQVNGKLRAQLQLPAGVSEEQAVEAAQANEKIAAAVDGAEIKKTIFVKDKLVNFVV
jgi:leucyl-tRNA synthetase